MKQRITMAMAFLLVFSFTSCNKTINQENKNPVVETSAVEITLSDEEIKVDGETVSSNVKDAVYIANDIVYYEDGKDFTYGEGTEKDVHSLEEAQAHTVIHITKAGTYSLSGKLSKGQIAVDLGENARKDPDAVVTLILNGIDITCEVAPAVIFYEVYECGSTDTKAATKDVDTKAAGANVIIADGTTNRVRGSYVERIYKPDTVVLNEEKTKVEDAKKLHKYDGAFYSKMSMNVNGGEKNTGTLDIFAENEGLDSELHLTVNGGNINIHSGNDGINTNEDGISVTTVNGGTLTILVTGETGEGDGIDSNGWLVINGGTVIASACANSADAGIDSDMGIYVNGGTVIATGHMLDRIEDGGQTYAVFSFAVKQDGTLPMILKNEKEEFVMNHTAENDYSILVYSSPDLKEGIYTLWSNEEQLGSQIFDMAGGFGMSDGMRPGEERPEGFPAGERPEEFQGGERPEEFQGGERPEEFQGGERPEGFPGGKRPEEFQGGERPELPEGAEISSNMGHDKGDSDNNEGAHVLTAEFVIVAGANMFSNVGFLE